MHRMRIGLIAAGLLLALTAAFYFQVSGEMEASVTRTVEQGVSRAQRVYQHTSRLGGMDFANLAAEKARRPSVVGVFDRGDEIAKRQGAFEECERMNADLQKEGRKADLLAMLDSTGKVLARDLNPNAMHGEDLRARFPAVDRALKGLPVKDTWNLTNRVTEVALAPITRPDGTIVGALLVGFVLSSKTAQQNRDLLGTEIGYFHGGKVHTSSFVSEGTGESAKEDVNLTGALNAVLFGGGALAEQALKKGGPTDILHMRIEGKEYALVAAPLPGNFADKTSGVVLLGSISDELGRTRGPGIAVLIFGIAAIFISLGAAVMTAKRFIKPLDQIELGVDEVIRGNIDHQFKPVGEDFEGLSNSLNVMLARLLGRDEPNEDAVEEEEGEGERRRWKADSMLIDEGDGSPSAAGQTLAQEGEASYYPRLYNEYLNAMRSTGKPTDGLSVQAFMAKLRLAEGGLREKWTCKMVRFQVVPQADGVVLRAVRIG